MAVTAEDLEQIITEVWDYFKAHGTGLNKHIILAPTDEAGWAQIKIVALKDDGSSQVTGILNLEAVLEEYGGDVVAAKEVVLAEIEAKGEENLKALDQEKTSLSQSLDSQAEQLKSGMSALVSDTLIPGMNSVAEQNRQEIEALKEEAEQAKDSAATYASNAKTSETNAKSSETAAKTSETNAKTAESNASKSASDAASSATTASEKAAEASGFASTALSYKTAAETAKEAAETAQGKAEEASSSAEVSKNAAATSANTASSKATSASESASDALAYKNAAESAQNAAESAQSAAESAQSAAESAAGTASTKASEASSSASTALSAKTAAETAKTAAEEAQAACQKLVESVDAEGLGERMDSLETALDGKAPSSHTHTIAQVTNLQSTLDGKAPSSHTHTSAQITDLQGKLNAKQNTITGAATTIDTENLTPSRALVSDGNGKVAVSAVTSTEIGYLGGVSGNVQTQLNGKAASSHTHSISQVSELQNTLNGKAAATHSHPISQITDLQTQLNGKAASSHSHSISQVSNLQTTLDGKLGKSANAVSSSKWEVARKITLSGDVSGNTSIDGSKDVTIEVTNERRHWPGEIFAFAGPSSKKPARTLLCNGGTISRTSYADLFAAIGTTYGAGDGSTTFNLPNLNKCVNDNEKDDPGPNNGVFLRAAVNDSQVGVKEQDAIRDITGGFTVAYTNKGVASGAFTQATRTISGQYDGHVKGGQAMDISFDAANVVTTATEVRPYAMRVLYLIAY